MGFPGGSAGKEPQCGRSGFDPWLGRSPGGGHDNPLQYSRLENPMDIGAWRATVHGVAKQSDMAEATEHTQAIRGTMDN